MVYRVKRGWKESADNPMIGVIREEQVDKEAREALLEKYRRELDLEPDPIVPQRSNDS
jgi:hypothetical protein